MPVWNHRPSVSFGATAAEYLWQNLYVFKNQENVIYIFIEIFIQYFFTDNSVYRLSLSFDWMPNEDFKWINYSFKL